MNASKPVVAFLDPHPPEVRAVIAAECPPELALRMTTSSDPAELRAVTAGAAFFVGGVAPIPAALIDATPSLRLIHKWGIGVDKIDLAAARARGVPVAITAGANAVPVAEFTLLLMLAVLRRLAQREAQLRAGEWWRARAETRAQAQQLAGKLVGLIGMGAIGRQVAKRLRAFDAEVCYYDVRRLTAEDERTMGVRFVEIDRLLAEADIVTLHVPLLESTTHLLSRARIATLKPGAIVINTARGPVVDEDALAEALEAGRLAGAGIDVFGTEPIPPTHPLARITAPGLVLTPHLAGSTYDNVARVARHVFGNIGRVLRGEPLPEADVASP